MLLFASCVEEDKFYVENTSIDPNSGIKILGFAQDFDVKKVNTRAGESDLPSDSHISEMTMFVFDINGKLLQGYTNREVGELDDKGYPSQVNFKDEHKCSSAINIRKPNPTFLIDTKEGYIASLDDASPRIIYYDHLTNRDNDLSQCKIYIVANAWHKLESELDNIATLAQLEAITLDIDATLSMPKGEDNHYRGFPMIGTHLNQTFDLSKTGNNAGSVAKIPLKKLYAKINFSIQVNANQVVSTPKFRIEKVEVFNVPNKAKLGRALNASGKPDYTDAADYIVEMVGNGSYTRNDYYQFTESPFVISDEAFSRKEISHTTSKILSPGSEYLIEFGFYMPEHKVTPNATSENYNYPDGIEEDLKQYYKPMLVDAVRNGDGTTTNGKNATFVRIHGRYTDHNAQIKNVRYDIYLGQDNTDDFTVKRNQLLNNKLVITGLTNYYDAYGDVQGNISIDHRVDVDYMGFNLSMEREAILDSHFEVRPLDIELSPGGSMTITIPEQYRSWVAMESDAAARGGNPHTYVNTSTPRKGVRKYFTTNLVSELTTANKGQIKVIHSGSLGTEIHRVWFYIDENPNVYDKLWKEGDKNVSYDGAVNDVVTVDDYTVNKTQYRNCPVSFKFIGTDNDNTDGQATVSKTVTVNFQQWNLWRVWNEGRTHFYDIECEEEYLNNYASDQQYGQTQDGMPWGLEGLQLSDTDNAFYIQSKTGSDYITELFSGRKANAYKYDFYISEAESNVVDYTDKDGDGDNDEKIYHPYDGLAFTKKIASKAIVTTNSATGKPYLNEKRTLVEEVESAVEYCYNKNKRNDNGQVAEVKWYLPAVDEIEDIAAGAYDEFNKVFQKNFYWSSQPAYIQKAWHGIFWVLVTINYNGFLYIDNLNHARSTSIEFVNGVKQPPTPSGMSNTNITVELGRMLQDTTPTESTDKNKTPTYDAGYDKRSEMNRIRAVYRSGTK